MRSSILRECVILRTTVLQWLICAGKGRMWNVCIDLWALGTRIIWHTKRNSCRICSHVIYLVGVSLSSSAFSVLIFFFLSINANPSETTVNRLQKGGLDHLIHTRACFRTTYLQKIHSECLFLHLGINKDRKYNI